MMTILILALQLLSASPAVPDAAAHQTNDNHGQTLSGQRQLSDLTPQERLELLALQRQLRSEEGIGPSETRQQCKDRLASKAPTMLEGALLDLKCSQRASRPR